MLAGLEPVAGRLDADQPHRRRRRGTDGTAPWRSSRRRSQATSASGSRPSASCICARASSPITALEVAHHGRIGVRAGDGADQVIGVVDVGHPVAHRLVHRVLQRAGAGGDRLHLGAEQLHAEHVGLLPLDVDRAHVDDAGQAEQRAHGGGGDAVLAGAGLGDDAGLAHAAGQQDLAHAVVDLVRAGVVQLVALEVDLWRRRACG